jgi:hypothetical protein
MPWCRKALGRKSGPGFDSPSRSFRTRRRYDPHGRNCRADRMVIDVHARRVNGMRGRFLLYTFSSQIRVRDHATSRRVDPAGPRGSAPRLMAADFAHAHIVAMRPAATVARQARRIRICEVNRVLSKNRPDTEGLPSDSDCLAERLSLGRRPEPTARLRDSHGLGPVWLLRIGGSSWSPCCPARRPRC